MQFWENILKYPRFFLSSVLGLLLVLLTPIITVFNEVKNKKIIAVVLFFVVSTALLTLYMMLNFD